MKIKSYSGLEYFFCFSLSIGLFLGKFITFLVSSIWIAITIVIVFSSKVNRESSFIINLMKLLRIFILPMIIIHIYTLLLIILGVADPMIFSTNASVYFGILLACCAVILFKEKSIKLAFYSIFFAWFLSFGKELLNNGLIVIRDSIAQGWYGISTQNYLEFHELLLAAAYYWCVYLFLNKQNKKKSILLFSLLFLMLILGVKRIGILAIMIVTVLYSFLKKKDLNSKKKWIRFLSLLGIVICFIYLIFVYNTTVFNKVMSEYGIDTMARNYFYEYICSCSKFELSYIGQGRGSVMELMHAEYSGFLYVHNDILKMYVEIGFVPFVLWLLYYFIYVRNYIQKHFGINSSYVYFIVNVFTFILYFTDNTESYFICVFIRTIIPTTFCLYNRNLSINNSGRCKKGPFVIKGGDDN